MENEYNRYGRHGQLLSKLFAGLVIIAIISLPILFFTQRDSGTSNDIATTEPTSETTTPASNGDDTTDVVGNTQNTDASSNTPSPNDTVGTPQTLPDTGADTHFIAVLVVIGIAAYIQRLKHYSR